MVQLHIWWCISYVGDWANCCAAVTASSVLAMTMGTLLQPGCFKTRSSCRRVRSTVAGVQRSTLLITMKMGTFRAMASPRCSRVVPAEKVKGRGFKHCRSLYYIYSWTSVLLKKKCPSCCRDWGTAVTYNNTASLLADHYGHYSVTSFMSWLSRMPKADFSAFSTEESVSWRHALAILFLCKQSLHAVMSGSGSSDPWPFYSNIHTEIQNTLTS